MWSGLIWAGSPLWSRQTWGGPLSPCGVVPVVLSTGASFLRHLVTTGCIDDDAIEAQGAANGEGSGFACSEGLGRHHNQPTTSKRRCVFTPVVGKWLRSLCPHCLPTLSDNHETPKNAVLGRCVVIKTQMCRYLGVEDELCLRVCAITTDHSLSDRKKVG